MKLENKYDNLSKEFCKKNDLKYALEDLFEASGFENFYRENFTDFNDLLNVGEKYLNGIYSTKFDKIVENYGHIFIVYSDLNKQVLKRREKYFKL